MKEKVIYSLIILLASCTSEFPSAPDLNSQEQEIPVHISFTVDTEEDIASRAPINSSFLENGSQVGVFAIKGKIETNNQTGEEVFINTGTGNYNWDKVNFQTNFFNECYEATTYIYNQQEYHQLKPISGIAGSYPSGTNSALKFYGYYPHIATEKVLYNANNPQVPMIPVEIKETMDNTTDYLYIEPKAWKASNNQNVSLTLKHALARLNIYIKAGKVYPPALAPIVNEITITTQYPQLGWLNLETGDISFNTTDMNVNKTFKTSNLSHLITPNNNNTIVCSHLFLPDPATINNNDYGELFQLEIKVTQNGISHKFRLDWEDLKSIQLRKGKITNLYINYNY